MNYSQDEDGGDSEREAAGAQPQWDERGAAAL